jgi:hypothetical protein
MFKTVKFLLEFETLFYLFLILLGLYFEFIYPRISITLEIDIKLFF